MNWKVLLKRSRLLFCGLFFIYGSIMQASNFPQPSQQDNMNQLERILNQSVGYMNKDQAFIAVDDYVDQTVKISDAMTNSGYKPTCTSHCVDQAIAWISCCAPRIAAQTKYKTILFLAQSRVSDYKSSERGFSGYVQLGDDNSF